MENKDERKEAIKRIESLNGKCEACGNRYDVVHQKTPVNLGGGYTPDNTIALCNKCLGKLKSIVNKVAYGYMLKQTRGRFFDNCVDKLKRQNEK